ncbi:hypothetical protein LX36DRAFT_80597 [Colletotrichum falcatum]|nr:hypothetical protein LX36DRAFT_80597 [Colletotrichum falcatum]
MPSCDCQGYFRRYFRLAPSVGSLVAVVPDGRSMTSKTNPYVPRYLFVGYPLKNSQSSGNNAWPMLPALVTIYGYPTSITASLFPHRGHTNWEADRGGCAWSGVVRRIAIAPSSQFPHICVMESPNGIPANTCVGGKQECSPASGPSSSKLSGCEPAMGKIVSANWSRCKAIGKLLAEQRNAMERDSEPAGAAGFIDRAGAEVQEARAGGCPSSLWK